LRFSQRRSWGIRWFSPVIVKRRFGRTCHFLLQSWRVRTWHYLIEKSDWTNRNLISLWWKYFILFK
jgi:hypothetical protein